MTREALRDRLRSRLLFEPQPLTFLGEIEEAGGCWRIHFADPTGRPGQGWLVLPDGRGPHPLVLVAHAHGNRYDVGARELLEGRPALVGPLGPALAARGIAAACLDLPCFGSRQSVRESAAAKAALWQGGSLAGRMLAELASQLDHLAGHAAIDAGRIGVFGLSMGATLGTWLSAMDLRVRALAQLCCLADLDELIAADAHDLHGLYLTVPGLPRIARNGEIAGLVAPRPQLVGAGARDPLTPPAALARALADLRSGYAAEPGALEVMVDPEGGHAETPAMRAAVLAFFGRHLAAPGPDRPTPPIRRMASHNP